MKWTKPKENEQRCRVNKFLWLPKTIGDETRWLEFASWFEQCKYSTYDYRIYWKPIKWNDIKKGNK